MSEHFINVPDENEDGGKSILNSFNGFVKNTANVISSIGEQIAKMGSKIPSKDGALVLGTLLSAQQLATFFSSYAATPMGEAVVVVASAAAVISAQYKLERNHNKVKNSNGYMDGDNFWTQYSVFDKLVSGLATALIPATGIYNALKLVDSEKILNYISELSVSVSPMVNELTNFARESISSISNLTSSQSSMAVAAATLSAIAVIAANDASKVIRDDGKGIIQATLEAIPEASNAVIKYFKNLKSPNTSKDGIQH